jgi:hypothetical protein
MDDSLRRPNRWRTKPAKDKTGQKFNSLTVIGFSHYELKNGKQKGRKLFWDCKCECGNLKKVENSNLISGSVSSCGCIIKESLKKLHEGNIKDDIAFEYILNDYVNGAKKRNYEFSLTKEEFKVMTQQNCYYCNIEPRQLKYKNGNHVFKKSSYVYNGIDRKDNNIGYTKENSVACCRTCNIAKAQMTVDEFLLWVKRVCEFNQSHPAIKGDVAI